jgi:hypothetical protein
MAHCGPRPKANSYPTMTDYVCLIRHSDSIWHGRFFNFEASIGRTFFDRGARGGWGDRNDVFAMLVDDRIVSTVGRTSKEPIRFPDLAQT